MIELTTKSEVTITMTGAEAHKLAVWMYQRGAQNPSSPDYEPVASGLLAVLQSLPEEVQ